MFLIIERGIYSFRVFPQIVRIITYQDSLFKMHNNKITGQITQIPRQKRSISNSGLLPSGAELNDLR